MKTICDYYNNFFNGSFDYSIDLSLDPNMGNDAAYITLPSDWGCTDYLNINLTPERGFNPKEDREIYIELMRKIQSTLGIDPRPVADDNFSVSSNKIVREKLEEFFNDIVENALLMKIISKSKDIVCDGEEKELHYHFMINSIKKPITEHFFESSLEGRNPKIKITTKSFDFLECAIKDAFPGLTEEKPELTLEDLEIALSTAGYPAVCTPIFEEELNFYSDVNKCISSILRNPEQKTHEINSVKIEIVES